MSPGLQDINTPGPTKTSDDSKDYYSLLGTYPFSNFIGEPQANKTLATAEAAKSRERSSSLTGAEESDSWLPCIGFFKYVANFKSFFSSFKRNERKDKEKKRKKESEPKGRPKKGEASAGVFGRKTIVGRVSDSEQDSDNDSDSRIGSKFKKDGQKRPSEVSLNSGARDGKIKADKAKGLLVKGKHSRDEMIDNRHISRRDSGGTTGRDIQNILTSRNDMLASRDSDSDASPFLKKNVSREERGLNERNKSFSPDSTRGMEKKSNDKHQRNNSSMI